MRSVLRMLLSSLVGLILVGCATKEYVRQTVGQSEAKVEAKLTDETKRIDEQGTKVTAQGKQIDEMRGRFTKVETSIDEVGNVARSAATRADEATKRAEDVDGRVTKLLAARTGRQLVETIQIQFGYNRADLSDEAQTALAELIKELADKASLEVDLEGYTDSRGTAEYNLGLSDRRAATVRRFLVQHGVDVSRIYWIGMGAVLDKGSKAEQAKNRRVTVRLFLPGEELTAQSTLPAVPQSSEPREATPTTEPEPK